MTKAAHIMEKLAGLLSQGMRGVAKGPWKPGSMRPKPGTQKQDPNRPKFDFDKFKKHLKPKQELKPKPEKQGWGTSIKKWMMRKTDRQQGYNDKIDKFISRYKK